ncbi:MAG TPA: fatty acid desaturase [Tepidisphaeraceae bacterium]|jgi:stearoyl-CoA desaturase (delta-9 desaturase)|nr:fatty acid desaturase [Tepidisphaeraceae bacterium]
MDIIPKHDQWNADVKFPREERMSFSSRMAVAVGVIGPFVGLLAAVALLWGRGIGWIDLWLLVGMYSLTVVGVTVGFHRLFTHKSFETHPWVRALLAIFGSMSIQGPVIKWCAIHRRHHQESDNEGDPHSPHLHGDGFVAMLKGMWHAHVAWIFEPDPENIQRSVKDLVADPILMWVNNWFALWVALGMIIPAACGFALTHSWYGALTGLLWGGLVRAFLMHHVTWSINSVCHVWGTRPFDSQDHSRNNFPIAIISFGEGWHNNHHAFPTSARHGLKWWQIDISYLFIRSMQLIGLAWNVRVPTPKAQQSKVRHQRKPITSPSAHPIPHGASEPA